MPNYPDHKPALCVMLTGSVISCAALVFAATSANAQSLSLNTGPEYSIGDFGSDADIVPTETTLSQHEEAASTSQSTSNARLSDGGTLATAGPGRTEVASPADGLALGSRELESVASRTFVLDNPIAQIVSPLEAIVAPTANENRNFSTGGVEYTLLDEAFQEPEFVYGSSANSRWSRGASDTVSLSGSLFSGGSFQTPPNEQHAAAFSHDYQYYSVVDGEDMYELTPLYFRPLTEQLNLAVRTYIGYEDVSPGNSDPIPYTGIGLTISRETWAK
ncbi:MAG: hypothetical protein AAFX54_10970 [Pseudomonadota bacterium]